MVDSFLHREKQELAREGGSKSDSDCYLTRECSVNGSRGEGR